MLFLSDIRDYIESLQIADHNYIGKLDNKQDRSIGVYQRNTNQNAVAVGGLKNKKYGVKSVSILIHWNKNARETEENAYAIYEKMRDIRNVTMNDTLVYYAMPQTPEPVDVGTDEKGVYERVIWLDIYYQQ